MTALLQKWLKTNAQKICALAMCFIILGIVVYGYSLFNGFVELDDDIFIFNNLMIQDIHIHTIYRAFTNYDPELYIPLTYLSLQIDWFLGNGSPFIFHLTNLLLHSGNAILVTIFTLLLSRKKSVGILCGLLFLLHPLQTEAVAWASARKDVLYSIFLLGSMVTYVLYTNTSQAKYYKSSIVLFFFSLLAKVSGLVLPVLLVLIDIYTQKPRTKKACTEKIPFFVLSILFGVIALIGKHHKKTDLLDTILVAGKSTVFYVQKFFVPVDFSVVYPYTGVLSFSVPYFYIPWITLLLLLTICVLSYNRCKALFFGLGLYFVCITPSFLNAFKGSQVFIASDRYPYIGIMGVFYVVSLAIWHIANGAWKQYKLHILAACSVWLCVLGFLSHKQSLRWENTQTLFATALSSTEQSTVALNNTALSLMKAGDFDSAITLFTKALSIEPNAIRVRCRLALLYAKKGEFGDAHQQVEIAKLMAPNDAEPYLVQGNIYAMQHMKEEAFTAYKKAIEIDPGFFEGRTQLILDEML